MPLDDHPGTRDLVGIMTTIWKVQEKITLANTVPYRIPRDRHAFVVSDAARELLRLEDGEQHFRADARSGTTLESPSQLPWLRQRQVVRGNTGTSMRGFFHTGRNFSDRESTRVNDLGRVSRPPHSTALPSLQGSAVPCSTAQILSRREETFAPPNRRRECRARASTAGNPCRVVRN